MSRRLTTGEWRLLFQFLFNRPVFFWRLLSIKPGPQVFADTELLEIVEVGFYCPDAVPVAKPTMSKH